VALGQWKEVQSGIKLYITVLFCLVNVIMYIIFRHHPKSREREDNGNRSNQETTVQLLMLKIWQKRFSVPKFGRKDFLSRTVQPRLHIFNW